MTQLRMTTVTTPVAPWTVIVDGDVVVGSSLTEASDLVPRLSAQLRRRGIDEVSDLGVVSEVIAKYLHGAVDALELVEVAQPGGPFFQRAWAAMRTIPAGATWTYGQLAAASGNPSAVRAAGGACAHNLIAPFVPCHRVVRSDGSIGGYYFGPTVKRWLLAHERGEETIS